MRAGDSGRSPRRARARSVDSVRATADAGRAAAASRRDRRRPASLRQARRCDPVRIRREQGPQARVRRRRHRDEGADTLITAGGVQSNHARATAAAAAKMGLRAVIVASGVPQERATANALLDALLGAEVVYVGRRDERTAKMHEIAATLRAAGRTPFEIPAGRPTSARRARLRPGDRRAARSDARPRRHRPLHVVRRHAGGARRGLPSARLVDARGRHQRGRSRDVDSGADPGTSSEGMGPTIGFDVASAQAASHDDRGGNRRQIRRGRLRRPVAGVDRSDPVARRDTKRSFSIRPTRRRRWRR